MLVEILNEAIGLAFIILRDEGQIERATALRARRQTVLSGQMSLAELRDLATECGAIIKPFLGQSE